MRRLWPDPVPSVTPAQQYTAVERRRRHDRPWLGVCMVASIDGSPVAGGRSGTLSSPTDHAVLLALREAASVVLVGASTVRAEGYGVPSRPGLRVGVVTASGNVDPSSALFSSGAGFLVTTEEAPDHGIEAVRAGQGRVDLPAALAHLEARFGASFVHAEGGPTLNGSLLDAGLVDEISLTVSPSLVGGDASRIVQGATEHLRAMELVHVCEDEGFIFLRYVHP